MRRKNLYILPNVFVCANVGFIQRPADFNNAMLLKLVGVISVETKCTPDELGVLGTKQKVG